MANEDASVANLASRLRERGLAAAAPLAQRAIDLFADRFAAPPRSIALAPGRINLIGEHTDYNGGLVLPVAIDRFIAIASDDAATERPGAAVHPTDSLRHSTFIAHDLGDSFDVDLADPAALGVDRIAQSPHWMRAVLGLLRERTAPRAQMNRSDPSPVRNMRMLIASSLPIGSGLSSSAALLCALSKLFAPAHDESPLELARLCRRIEHEHLGTPCGLMDPLAIAAARPGCAIRLDCATGAYEHIHLPPENNIEFLILDTGVRRALADGRYAQRRAECEAAARELGLPADRLAHADPARASALADPTQRKRAEHVVREQQRVDDFIAALHESDLRRAGELLFASHASLRDDFDVSFPEADALVHALQTRAASSHKDVDGARLIGGGFGGCVLALVVPGAAPAIIDFLDDESAMSDEVPAQAFTASSSAGPAAFDISDRR